MLKRTGAGAGAAENAGQIVDRAPTWSSPGKSTHSPLVLYVLCLWYCHLKQRHIATDINTQNSVKCVNKIYNWFSVPEKPRILHHAENIDMTMLLCWQ